MLNNMSKSQMIKLLGSFISTFFLGVLVILVIVMYLNPSLGWFSRNKEVAGNGIGVATDSIQFPDIHAWRFDLDANVDGDEDGDTLDKDGSWVDAVDHNTSTNPEGMLPVITKTYGSGVSGEKFTFRSLHLGTIDNLLTLSNDNCFYIRFDVTDEIYRTAIGYSLGTTNIRFYDVEGNDETSAIGSMVDENSQSLEVLQKCVDLLIVEAAVSSEEYEPFTDQSAIDALFTMTGETRNEQLTNGAALKDLGEQSDDYFVYIRLSPDLEMCFEATDHIATYMPCQITFDITFSLAFD